ncbi:MAG: virulence RhuM family protein [Treponema sp.]|nr:virulence RhuM family protein [Treponema sp.]
MKKEISINSAAGEYLTYIASTGTSSDSIEVRYEDENIWLTQKMLARLYEVETNTINYHIKKIFEDKELDENSTIRNFRIVQTEGSRQISRDVVHYDLQMIIAVGFKVNSARAVQFRKWVNKIAKDYTIRGYVLDKERFMQSNMPLTDEYFEHLLEDIREIRMSERRFYQKITDIYATSIDYDKSSKTTHDFFANVQNKLHWAIHKHTAAELIMERANATKPNMGLTSWRKAPDGKIEKSDVSIAKNYLEKEELENLQRIVAMYLDYAEFQAKNKNPMTMEDWANRLNRFLEFNEQEILQDNGRVTHEIAKAFAENEYEKFRLIQDKNYKSDFDNFLLDLENEAKNLETR